MIIGLKKCSCITSVLLAVIFSCLLFAVQPTSLPTTQNGHTGLYKGIPKADCPFEILPSAAYIVGYDEDSGNPAWVAYYIPPIPKKSQSGKRPSTFTVDSRTKAKITNQDYAKTGYDKGHMAPNYAIGSRYGTNAQLETFLLSNICPQTPRLNRGIWKSLESLVANQFAQKRGVWVVTGPLYGNRPTFIKERIKKPCAFFKIIIALNKENQPEALAFIIPQNECSGNLENYLVNIDTIEALSGINFFSDLPDDIEDKLESQKACGFWN